MTKRDYLGEFESVVLLAVARLGSEAYGMRIRREIHERAERDVSIGAVYATLERLESKGYVSSSEGEPVPAREGRARRYFVLTGAGVLALRAFRQIQNRMWAGLRLRPVKKP